MKKVYIFSDGGSQNNGGKEKDKEVLGSYAFLLVNEDKKIIKEKSNIFHDVTNNQMELFGFIDAAITFLSNYNFKNKNKYQIVVYSDSQYLIKGITEWMPNWIKNNWKTASKKKVENVDLWMIINDIVHLPTNLISFKFLWCKGHNGKSTSINDDYVTFFNENCDSLCTKEIMDYNSPNKLYILQDFKEVLAVRRDALHKVLQIFQRR